MKKTKTCLVCEKEYVQFKSTDKVCSVSCAIKYAKEKTKADTLKAWQKEKRIRKKKSKTYTQRLQEARKVFQAWIRKRDEEQPCISCATYSTDLWDAGHYFKAELYSALIFNENNCHKQCRKCNRFKGGNEANYAKGLIQRFGQEYLDNLNKLSDSLHKARTYSNEELEAIKQKYKL